MAMTGLRRVSVGLGIVDQTPPEELVEEGAPRLAARIAPERREATTELVHWTVGAVGGALYALLPEGLRRRPVVGSLYGLAILAVFETLIRPAIDPPRGQGARVGERLALAADHVLYGLVLAQRFPPRA